MWPGPLCHPSGSGRGPEDLQAPGRLYSGGNEVSCCQEPLSGGEATSQHQSLNARHHPCQQIVSESQPPPCPVTTATGSLPLLSPPPE